MARRSEAWAWEIARSAKCTDVAACDLRVASVALVPRPHPDTVEPTPQSGRRIRPRKCTGRGRCRSFWRVSFLSRFVCMKRVKTRKLLEAVMPSGRCSRPAYLGAVVGLQQGIRASQ
jgi:hypothetical protein